MSLRRTARRRGYLAVRVRDRGPIGRGLRREFQAASRQAWYEVGVYWHTHLRERRFDPQHQRAAGFALRRGQGMPRDSKGYRRSYTGRKERRFGHTHALEYTGDTRRNIRAANISSTGNRSRIAYPGARTFNYRHPKSRIRMFDEFRRMLPEEIEELAEYYDSRLDEHWPSESSDMPTD